jgi:hypothetical protein
MLLIVEADPAQPPPVPDEAAGLDDRKRHVETRGKTHGSGRVDGYVGLEEGDAHETSGTDAGDPCDMMRLSVTVLAPCASVF